MGNWQLDPYHTQVEFSARHLGMMNVRGRFEDVSAVADIDPDNPEGASVEVTIQTVSVKTNNPARDNDLRGGNFLDVENYPVITFKSTGVQATGENQFKLNGDLTIKDTTLPVTLHVTKYGELNDPMMGHRIAYSAQTEINRKDYGLTFNMMLDGRWMVSDEIHIEIEGELAEQKDAAEAASG